MDFKQFFKFSRGKLVLTVVLGIFSNLYLFVSGYILMVNPEFFSNIVLFLDLLQWIFWFPSRLLTPFISQYIIGLIETNSYFLIIGLYNLLAVPYWIMLANFLFWIFKKKEKAQKPARKRSSRKNR